MEDVAGVFGFQHCFDNHCLLLHPSDGKQNLDEVVDLFGDEVVLHITSDGKHFEKDDPAIEVDRKDEIISMEVKTHAEEKLEIKVNLTGQWKFMAYPVLLMYKYITLASVTMQLSGVSLRLVVFCIPTIFNSWQIAGWWTWSDP